MPMWRDDGDLTLFKERLEYCVREHWLNLRRSALPAERTVSALRRTLIEDLMSPPRAARAAANAASDADKANYAPLELARGVHLPYTIATRLYPYQRVGLRWLHQLHVAGAGGIVGDEMGLGKTVQIVTFLAALHAANKLDGPVLIVCPATVLEQWTREFHIWWPCLRICVFHDSGSYTSSRRRLLANLDKHSVLITTYNALRIQCRALLPIRWSYAVLDEGHKIRNPNADVTVVAKQLDTPHRIILSGSPIQNKLSELWSLFDFVYPGKLGTLVVFEREFEVPIRSAGRANASQFAVRTAFKCAQALRTLVQPYLLRRLKRDVLQQLPNKTEQVLFCKLTRSQVVAYERFLQSPQAQSIQSGKMNLLYGIDALRKICNHPDLLAVNNEMQRSAIADYGNWRRSGKLRVLERLFPLWHQNGHKVLLFAQTRQMTDILQHFLSTQNYTFRRMDGTTAIARRQHLIDEFNTDASIFCFILTTKVGGVGVNLIGADRIVIFDPDWNPQTDVQARERAWRIGQLKAVTIFRLMTAGTIEEKIYHRQIFKQFLSNQILKNPRRQMQRMLRDTDMRSLFKLESNVFIDDQSDGGGHDGREVTRQYVAPPSSSSSSSSSSSAAAAAGAFASGSRALTATGRIFGEQNRSTRRSSSSAASNGSNGNDSFTHNILQSLFDGGDVGAVVAHDAVERGESAGGVQGAEAQLDAEATTAAKRALDAVRESRAACASAPLSEPTWTGVVGSAGKENGGGSGGGSGGGAASARARAPSSVSLLATLRQGVGSHTVELSSESSNE